MTRQKARAPELRGRRVDPTTVPLSPPAQAAAGAQWADARQPGPEALGWSHRATELAHTALFDPPAGWGCILSEVFPSNLACGGPASSWPRACVSPADSKIPLTAILGRMMTQPILEEVSAGQRGSHEPLSHAYAVPL